MKSENTFDMLRYMGKLDISDSDEIFDTISNIITSYCSSAKCSEAIVDTAAGLGWPRAYRRDHTSINVDHLDPNIPL